MTPGTKFALLSKSIASKDLRMAVYQPFRRTGRGRPHDDAKVLAGQCFNRAVKPIPVELSWMWFDAAPAKFADPHPADTESRHGTGIICPHLLAPVFGIVADT
jgi:hypothetical protein